MYKSLGSLFWLAVFAFLPTALVFSQPVLKPGYALELLTDELLQPTSVAVADDGRIFVTQKGGTIRVLENDQLLGTPFLSLEVDQFGERGLGHILLDQDFGVNGYFYVYYTRTKVEHNRIARFTSTGNVALPQSEHVIMDLAPMASTIHNGGTMRWGQDGKLFVSTGEGASSMLAQDTDSELGKMLRINKDGTIPTDNPFYDSTNGNARAIWAKGLRNPFTFDIDPASGRTFVNDVGLTHWEEVNEILEGRNYGWPTVDGPLGGQTPPPDYMDPVVYYDHFAGCAVIGALAYNYPASTYPPEIQNHYLFGDFCSGYISMYDLATNQVTDTFALGISNLTNMTADPTDGTILFLEFYTGKLWRIHYIGTGAPFISEQPSDQIHAIGETATFEILATSTDSLGYQWLRDGQPLPGAEQAQLEIQNVQNQDSGAVVQCQVMTATDTVISDTALLIVTTNTRPQVTIALPDPNIRFKSGDTLYYTGSALDAEDGQVPNGKIEWSVDLHHDEHTHPILPPTPNVDTGMIVMPYVGETDTNQWYRIRATAFDQGGLTGTAYVDIHPEVAMVELRTNPSGLGLFLEGGPIDAPYDFPGIVESFRTIYAPARVVRNDSLFEFAGWVGHSADTIEFNIPAGTTRFTALFNYVAEYVIGDGQGLQAEYYENYNFEGEPRHEQVDPNIDFRWEWGGPTTLPEPLVWQFARDSFSVRWTGDLLAPTSGEYKLLFDYDDRIRFTFDGDLLIDSDAVNGDKDTLTLNLLGGRRYEIKLEYIELRWTSRMTFKWITPYYPKEAVPQTQLFPEHVDQPDPPEPTDSLFNTTSIFPTPLGNEFYINLHDPEERGPSKPIVTIYNGTGAVVKRVQLETYSNVAGPVDISDLPGGTTYLVEIFNGGLLTTIVMPKIK